MRIAIITVIGVAALIAWGVFYLFNQFIEEEKRAAYEQAAAEKPGVEAVEIIVADRDLPAGTVIESSQLRWQPWPDDSLDSDYIVFREEDENADKSDLEDQIIDMVVRRAIMAGEPITVPKLFVREEATFLAGMLSPGMRAVAIKVKDVTGVGGFVMPGDRVDVILTMKWKVDQKVKDAGLPFTQYTSETVVQNARVLGIDQAFDDIEENAVKADTVTIEVTPKQAEVLNVASNAGSLSLSLRSLTPGSAGAYSGFTSDREALYSMGGDFPATERLAEPVRVAGSAGSDDTKEAGVLPVVKKFRVITAVRDLSAGTLLREGDLEWAPLPQDLSPEEFIVQGREHVNLASFVAAVVADDVEKGRPVKLESLIMPGDSRYIASMLTPGMRAAAVPINPPPFSAIAGDEVDVVLIAETGDRRYSETILQNVRVLGGTGNAAFIEVTPKQFEKVAVAQAMGTLQLALRSDKAPDTDVYAGAFTSDLEVSRALSGGVEAIVAGGGAGVAAKGEESTAEPPVRSRVLVAERDLPAGTLLRDSDFRFELLDGPLPADAGYFFKQTTNVEALRGALVVKAMASNEALSRDKLIKPGEQGFLAAALRPNMRAVSIEIDAVTGVSGFVSPGDLVDVLMTQVIRGIGDNPVLQTRVYTETIVQNIRVLAIEQRIDESSGKPVVGKTVTMEVTPKEAETLALGARVGELSLVLHGAAAEGVAEASVPPYTSNIDVSKATASFVGGREGGVKIYRATNLTTKSFAQ